MSYVHFDSIASKTGGYAVGERDQERQIINQSGYLLSGSIASGAIQYGCFASGSVRSGSIFPQSVGMPQLVTGLKYDGGSVGVSGTKLSVSTAISSILMALATMAISGVNNSCHFALVGWSGHCIDIDLIALNASGIIVGNYSSKVNWFVMGN